MKKIVSLILILALSLSLFGCTRKSRPAIDIKYESVQSVYFKRTVFSTESPDKRDYFVKSVTDTDGIKSVLDWIESLDLEKHSAIEVPLERVEYVIILNGVKDHTVVFYDNYVIYDTTAFTYKDESHRDETAKCYNMLNYEEKQTELNLVI